MLDFGPVRRKEITLTQLVAGLQVADLRALTAEMIAAQLNLLADCVDADISFVPMDADAYDSAAGTEEEVNLAWTLGHVIVHITASAEESAFLAAELARGATYHGRSRYEVPWPTMTTVAACRARLEESRRMRLATLDVWPDPPHLDNTYQTSENGPHINAVERFVRGLSHDDSHLAQLAEIARQARVARQQHTPA